MIKVETLGMIDVAKINPVLKAEKAVKNYSFMTDNEVVYLISNTVVGDHAYNKDEVFAAGEYLNGYEVAMWKNQKLVIDEEHITYAEGKGYADLEAGVSMLTINEDVTLAVADAAPASGVYFVVTDKVMLTGKAVKARVMIAG